jgi:type VI secretion system protein ImpL
MEAELDQHFAALRRLAGDGKAAPEMDAALQTFTDIATDLTAVQQKIASGAGLRELPPGFAKARLQGDRFAMPVSGAILALVSFAEGEASGGVKKEMKAGVGGAAALCARSIPGKYPFVKGSSQDLGVQDFVTIFKSGGELDAFFTTNLAPFVDRSDAVWRLKSTGEGAPPVSPATLRQFQNADAIRNAFLGGGTSPAVVADISATAADGEVTLEYDGNVQKMKVGTSGARVTWPARPSAKLMLNGQMIASAEGPWALFRLVEKGTPEFGGGGDKLKVGFPTPSGNRLMLEVRSSSSAFNPFRLRELDTFACPRE